MNSQELRALQEAYLDVYNELDEGYKDLPKGKMLKKGIGVGFDYLKRSVKAGIEGPDTTGGQIEMQKREKSLKRAEKIDTVARGHEPEESQRKSTVNKSIGKMKRGQHPNAAIRDARAETRSQSKQRKPNRFLDNVKKGLESTFDVDESFDLYDIILSHLLDEGYAETQEQAEVIMVNMSEDWRESIVEGYQEPKFGRKDYIKKLSKRGGMGMGTPEDPHGYRDPGMAKVGAEFSKRKTAGMKAKKSGEPDTYRSEKESQSKNR